MQLFPLHAAGRDWAGDQPLSDANFLHPGEGLPTGLWQFARLPYQVLEDLNLPARYERSFKLRPGTLLAQRYLLGVPTAGQTPALLGEVARRLGMPGAQQDLFEQALEGASTALYGFEGGPEGALFKAYAEYSTRSSPALMQECGADPPAVEMFRGFKWRAGSADAGIQTCYSVRPGLGPQQVRALADARLRGQRLDALHGDVLAMLTRALAARPGYAPIWLDLGEVGSTVRAFDLNLYDAGLRVQDIAGEVAAIGRAFLVDALLVQRLLAASGPGLLGHVSAGLGREGQPYLTVYFEP
jgi:hypothetical protein